MRRALCTLTLTVACCGGLAAAGDESPFITKHYVDLSGGQLHYVTAGSGPVVLLLHQAPLSHAEFLPAIRLLAEHYSVVAWDAPGHGSSYIPPTEYGFLEYLAVLHELIEALGLEPVHIVGNHSGAAFAREYAAAHPEKVGKIVLCGSAFEPPDAETELVEAREFLSQPYSRSLAMDIKGTFLVHTWKRYVTLASPQSDSEDVLIPFIIGLEARTKPYDMHDAIFGYDEWSNYETVETPVLLLSGADDIFVNQERLDYTCTQFHDCRVHSLVEGAGAFIGIEQPQAFAEAIHEFLSAP